MRQATVRQLQVFVTAARFSSFARAAERLHLTPAAVSFQIKQLETIAGFLLFERTAKKVSLTDAGHVLLDYAEMIIKALADADQTLTSLKGLKGGRVTVGLVTTAVYVMPHILARFRTLYPNVSIRIIDGNRRAIVGLLAKGDIDVALMGQPPDDDAIEAEPFAPHPTVFIASASHPLVGRKAISPAELAAEPFLYREEGSGTRALIENFFSSCDLNPKVFVTSSSNETIKQAVMTGMGVAGISRHAIGIELGLGLLKVLQVEGTPLKRSWFVAHRRRMPLMPLHQALLKFVLTDGRKVIEDLEKSYASLIGKKISRPTRPTAS